ncbi:MAG: serine/threonine protein kinase [Acetatifactor sp.]
MEKRKGNHPPGDMAGYEILEELGSGVTARVYRVQEKGTGRVCALKYSDDAERLKAEAVLLRGLSHPCFPRWMGDGVLSEGAYLVMEYIPGMTLGRLMDKYPAGMPERAAAGIAREVAMGLACLHGSRPMYVYRDIKADNVMITPQGRARLVDLGAVCAAGAQGKVRAGTYGYSAPEQFWNGADISPACDVYGVGKLLAYMLTGQDPCKPPYDTENYCCRHSGIGRRMQRLLEHCLYTDPQLRYPDASFLVSELSDPGTEKRGLRDMFRKFTGNKCRYRYIKCIWRSEYERIF